MSNITVTHAESGLMRLRVLRSTSVTPHVRRVTFAGPDLRRFRFLGFDQWVRLAIPAHAGDRFDNLPDRFGLGGSILFQALPRKTRPIIRNYTIRDFRDDPLELDIDFVVHGDDGVAGPWAVNVQPDAEVALIDQGCGWQPVAADWTLIIADESGLPATAGILRHLSRDSTGHAMIELFDHEDRQPVDAPPGMQVHWLERHPARRPGAMALPALAQLVFPTGTPYVFAVGESALATGARRLLIGRGVPKTNITFSGYWRKKS